MAAVLAGLWPLASSSAARRRGPPAPYTLRQSEPTGPRDVVSLYDTRTGRTLWRVPVGDVERAGWSADRRAVALCCGFPPRLLVWREGRRPFMLADPRLAHQDGVLGFAWSSDRRRLLLRTWASGGETLNSGDLYCLDVARRWLYEVPSPAGVRRMRWAGPRTVHYWTVRFYEVGTRTPNYVVSPRPLVWRCP